MMVTEGNLQATKPDSESNNENAREIITAEEINDAFARLRKYAAGKKSIDDKATANQEWWRGRHWSQIEERNSTYDESQKPTSAWLFNSIINKHADMMDNFPKPNVLPRHPDDIEDAQSLGKIIPCILEQNGYQKVYSKKTYDYIGDGTAITGVFWDNQRNSGLGDIVIKQIDIHNIFWKPGVDDIQDSPEVFTVAAVSNDELKKQYPQLEKVLGNEKIKVEYIHDDSIDTSDMSEVIDWYYKTVEYEEVPMDELGTMLPRPRTVLHYCKFCNGEVLYSSENEGLDRGFYHHGKYPFVFQALFPIKDSPVGFGYIDVMKDPQKYIDTMDQMLSDNAYAVGKSRWFVRESLGVDPEEFRDMEQPFVKFTGNLTDSLLPIEIPQIPAFVLQYQTNKVEELKETSGNRDFSQGSAAQGVTAASAIAALQEAGSKLARDMVRGGHLAHQEECYFVIELIRQFYTEPRAFRIDDGSGGYDFEMYDNSNIVETPDQRMRPIFDLQVVAEKQSPFSRAAQNETAKEMYNMGFFNPEMAEPALVALGMMDFEGKDDIIEKVQSNSVLMQQVQQMAQAIQMFDASYPEFGLAQAAGLAPAAATMGAQMAQGGGGNPAPASKGTPEERAARHDGESTSVAKARQRAAQMATVR